MNRNGGVVTAVEPTSTRVTSGAPVPVNCIGFVRIVVVASVAPVSVAPVPVNRSGGVLTPDGAAIFGVIFGASFGVIFGVAAGAGAAIVFSTSAEPGLSVGMFSILEGAAGSGSRAKEWLVVNAARNPASK